mmetsp:Transcript_22429/g.56072  ORF Transcript_22429/g.56072 Transcript_22429/m.56072 type:complete len:223 (+) Transcript_22429:396-1064(+)
MLHQKLPSPREVPVRLLEIPSLDRPCEGSAVAGPDGFLQFTLLVVVPAEKEPCAGHPIHLARAFSTQLLQGLGDAGCILALCGITKLRRQRGSVSFPPLQVLGCKLDLGLFLRELPLLQETFHCFGVPLPSGLLDISKHLLPIRQQSPRLDQLRRHGDLEDRPPLRGLKPKTPQLRHRAHVALTARQLQHSLEVGGALPPQACPDWREVCQHQAQCLRVRWR